MPVYFYFCLIRRQFTHLAIYIYIYIMYVSCHGFVNEDKEDVDKASTGEVGTVQLPWLKAWSKFSFIVLCVILQCLLSLRGALQVFSKKETIWLMVRRQTSRFSARIDHQREMSNTTVYHSGLTMISGSWDSSCPATTSVAWPQFWWSSTFQGFQCVLLSSLDWLLSKGIE